MKTVVVTGATSLIGHFLLPRLKTAGYRIIAVSRTARTEMDKDGVVRSAIDELIQADISSSAGIEFPATDLLIHLAPLWLLPDLVQSNPRFENSRIIAFSSTSRLSKADSSSDAERLIAEKLADAEEKVLAARARGVTIFRPTLIYGDGLDKNISTIAHWICRFRFFPLVGAGRGLRQPVHADDLAKACLQVVNKPETEQQIYETVGGETLTYRKMVGRVFAALQIRPRILSLPFGMIRPIIRFASVFPGYKDLKPEMALRMNQDLVFDSTPARQDFGYSARSFHPSNADVKKGF